MSRILTSLFSAALVLSCSAAATSGNYDVTVKFTPDEDGLRLYMVNYDDGVKIDSADVVDGSATMKGEISAPVMAQLVLDGNRAGSFILEPASTTVVDTNTRSINSTGALNTAWDTFNNSLQEIVKGYNSIYSDANMADADKKARLEALETRYNTLTDSMFNANSGNIIGYRLFLDRAYELTPAEFESALVNNPEMAGYTRVKKLRTSKANEAATSVGNKFKDFAVTNDSATQRLSDYVGRGKWTLVDFWASWCGPCIRETATLKKLHSKYADKGLDFLGVAVWDEPQNTLKAIKEHDLPWPMIINAQTIPTDLYGIAGIPCIILFDPEGNIVSRGKQGQDLVDDVEKAMESANANK
ncbi:MAG: AhpC/TSA family protein [Firmicutes bacterium]|nr:AhpC/TSA family protein [Bacillota bacterium]MCM1400502.1 AhpC/TSA family protein [Bacteroides sp.]